MNDTYKSFIIESLIRTAQLNKITIHEMHIREAFPLLKEIFRKGQVWSPGKFSRTIGNVKAETIKHYIKNHQFKELNQSIHDARSEAEQMRLSAFF